MNKLLKEIKEIKEFIEGNPASKIIGLILAVITTTWIASEHIRVNPLQQRIIEKNETIQKYEGEIKEYKIQLEKYKSVSLTTASELESLIVYKGVNEQTVGHPFVILAGQVSVTVDRLFGMDQVDYTIEAPGEELQKVSTTSGKRATFKFNQKEYIITIIEIVNSDQFRLMVSELPTT